jgi:energy-coupling factor transporter ATP-binding protein EcfA2
VGFNPDLPARENVMINATMLGLSPREARRRFDEVIDFAELHDFVDLKLKNYSSGMMVRLAFAVMIQVDASILLIDEVLAVGDASFQQKCFDEFGRIREEGRTVLLVTHDMAAVERYCDRAMLLERGELTLLGEPHEVGMRYLQVNFADEDAGVGEAPSEEAVTASARGYPGDGRYGDGRAEILEAWFEDASGRAATSLPYGERCAFAVRVRFKEEVTDPVFGMNLANDRDDNVLAAHTERALPHSGAHAAGEELTVRFRFDNVLSAGRYHATPAVAHLGQGVAWLDRRERMLSVIVTSTQPTDAVVDLPYEVEVDRSGVTA